MAYGIIILLLRSTQTLHHFGCNGLRSGFTVNIIHFRRIFLQVIQFPFIYIIIEMNKFIAVCAYSIMALHCMLCRIFMIVIIQLVAPLFRFFPAQQRHQRLSLYVRRHVHTGQLHERRCIVNVLHHSSTSPRRS